MQIAATYFLFLILVLVSRPVYGFQVSPHEKMGRPFNVQTFAGEQTFDRNENWSIVQNEKGLIYAANVGGVLEFDGHLWRLIKLANNNSAFSLGLGTDDTIYVGARGDFGYLAADSTGTTIFVSMLEHVPEENRDFLVVWGTHVTDDAVFFHTWKYLFRWDGERITSWPSEERLHTSFVVNDRLFIKRDGTGLLEVIGDSLSLIEEGEQFADTRVFIMDQLDDEAILIGTQSGMDGPLKLFRYSDREIHEIDVDPHLLNRTENYTFYHGTRLRDSYYVLGTLYDGIFIIDAGGNLLEALDSDRSIPDDINFIYSDLQGGIWLAHHSSGITHVGTPLSLSEFSGPGGSINDMVRHQGRFYIATDEGLFVLADRRDMMTEDSLEGIDGFIPVFVEPNTKIRWSLLSYGEELLVTTEVGIFSIHDETSSRVAFDHISKPKIVHESQYVEGRIYVGLENGLGMMTDAGERWIVEKNVGSIRQAVTSIAEDMDGALWISTRSAKNEVWRLTFNEEGRLIEEQFITDSEHLESKDVTVDVFGDSIGVVAPPIGIYRYAPSAPEQTSLFIDKSLTSTSVQADSIISIHSIDSHKFWVVYPNYIAISTIKQGGTVSQYAPHVLRLREWKGIGEVYIDEKGVGWIGYTEGLLRYDPVYEKGEGLPNPVDPMIRNVSIVWTDSTLYGGFSQQVGALGGSGKNNYSLTLGHDNNDLRFDFALPDFNRMGTVQYQHLLEGHDENWSGWSTNNFVIYRNVESGKHNFIVRARAGGQVVDNAATISFRIMPPWYDTWWMRIVYAFFMIFPVVLLIRYARAKRRLVELERKREFFEQINRANAQLRAANSSLEQANKMKDEFLANASHELRTPLTAILGFTSVLKEELRDEQLEFVGLIDENGKRLLQTINSLLDLARLRAGMVDLNMKPIEVNEKAEEVVELLGQLARNQNLDLTVKKAPYRTYALLDDNSFERVLYNLIGNAIKFTPQGSVVVEVEPVDEMLNIHVHDTGVGIDAKFMPYLFDEFKQEPSSMARSKGSGLGLAISAKLVSLMNGRIDVKSEKGVGTTFTVSFPLENVERINGQVDHEIHPQASPRSTV